MTKLLGEMILLNYGLFGVGYFLFVNTVHYSQACDSFLTNEWMNFLFMMLGFLGTASLSTFSNNVKMMHANTFEDTFANTFANKKSNKQSNNNANKNAFSTWTNTLLMHMYVLCALLLTDSVYDANYNIFILLLAFAFIVCSELGTAYIMVAIIAEVMAFVIMLILVAFNEPQHYFEQIHKCHVSESLAMSMTSGVIHAIPLCATMELNSIGSKFVSARAQGMTLFLHILVMLILVLAPAKVWVASLLDTATMNILMHGVSNVELLTIALQCVILFTVIAFTIRYNAEKSHNSTQVSIDYTKLWVVFLIAGTCKQYYFVQIKWIYIATAIVYVVDKLAVIAVVVWV